MPTDTERLEVAARLRHSWANVPDKNPMRHQLRVLFEIYSAVGLADDDDADAIDLFDRLADLIEPDEPPYNLYTLYETVLHRSPRCWACIEDDEVDELVDALLDICNVPGHELIQRFQPSEPKVSLINPMSKSYAVWRLTPEVKIDGERPEELAHDAAVELTGIDRDALLALADEMERMPQCELCPAEIVDCSAHPDGCPDALLDHYARRIREALGESDG